MEKYTKDTKEWERILKAMQASVDVRQVFNKKIQMLEISAILPWEVMNANLPLLTKN